MKRFYFSPAHPLFSNDFALRGVGVEEAMPPSFVDRPHGTEAWLWVYFHDPVTVRCAGQEHVLDAGRLVVWKPGAAHYFGHPTQAWNHSWLHLCGARVDRLMGSFDLPLETPIRLDAAALTGPLEACYRELLIHAAPDHRILESVLRVLLVEATRAAGARGATVLSPQWQQLCQHLAAHVSEPWTTPEMARRVGLSASHFTAEFRRHFGQSPQPYLERMRMDKAAHLLADQGWHVAEVARAVGFEDPLYFSKRFRKTEALAK